MRWTSPKEGDIRIVRRFLLVPMGYPEVRWLEWATLRYKWDKRYWNFIGFVDEEEETK